MAHDLVHKFVSDAKFACIRNFVKDRLETSRKWARQGSEIPKIFYSKVGVLPIR